MIWTRTELKEQAKEALHRNYWRIVLVSFLSFVFCSGFFGGGNHNNHTLPKAAVKTAATESAETTEEPITEEEAESQAEEWGTPRNPGNDVPKNAQIAAVTVFILIAAIVLVFLYTLQVLLIFPFRVGVNRFMIKSIDGTAKVRETAYGFDHSYKNVIKTMFHYDIRIFLWTLLFIIPGFYKQYQYRMVPYILAEQPDMNYREVLQKSADIMNGHKWKTFVLDLSFILWHICGLMTCGILEIFYVIPWQDLTSAALYRKLNTQESLLPQHSEPLAAALQEVHHEL